MVKSLYKEVYSVMNQGVTLNELILNEQGDAVDYIILEANDSYAEFIGKAKNEIVGKRILDVIPQFNRAWIKAIGDITKKGTPKRFEKYTVELDKYFELDVLPSGVDQFVVLATDITQKKLKERQMAALIEELTTSEEEIRSNYLELEKAKNEKENVLNLKNQFFAYISHEIKTPLNGIYAFSKLLSQTEMDSEQQEYLKMIQESSVHVMELVDNLITDADAAVNIEKGELELNLKRFNIKDMFHRVIKEFLFICEYRNLKFNYSLDTHIPLTILGDEVAINQILVEILNNLVKYTNHGEISLNVNKIFQVNNKVTLQFEIKDTGIKFKDELSERILHSTSLELIKMMNGQAWMKDNPDDSGSSVFFTVEFLLDTAAMPDINEIAFSSSGNIEHISKTIMVVEENHINMKIVTEMLKRCGYNMIGAVNGKEAMDLFCIGKPDLILMDVHMAGQDGFETAENIRRLEKPLGIHVPIIGTMSQSVPGSMELCINSGMEDYLLKPFEVNKLERVIKEYI